MRSWHSFCTVSVVAISIFFQDRTTFTTPPATACVCLDGTIDGEDGLDADGRPKREGEGEARALRWAKCLRSSARLSIADELRAPNHSFPFNREQHCQ